MVERCPRAETFENIENFGEVQFAQDGTTKKKVSESSNNFFYSI